MCHECVEPASDPPLCHRCYVRRYGARMVAHAPVFAIFLMIHGAVLSIAGAFFLLYGGSLGVSFGTMPEPTGQGTEGVRSIENMVVGLLLVVAIGHLVAGVLQLWAGWRMRTFRSRPLVFTALIAGLITVVGCYCLPTSMGILIWGLIVVLHPAVAERFAAQRRSDS